MDHELEQHRDDHQHYEAHPEHKFSIDIDLKHHYRAPREHNEDHDEYHYRTEQRYKDLHEQAEAEDHETHLAPDHRFDDQHHVEPVHYQEHAVHQGFGLPESHLFP